LFDSGDDDPFGKGDDPMSLFGDDTVVIGKFAVDEFGIKEGIVGFDDEMGVVIINLDVIGKQFLDLDDRFFRDDDGEFGIVLAL
jgi:hypothetical protein